MATEEPAQTATGRRSYSQSLERGLAILSSFTSVRPLLGVSELAREVGLNRSTTHRYIATLATLGYLQQDALTKKYRLGPRVVDLGFSAINSMELREIAAPHLQRLSDESGHTVNMAILDGADIVYIERCRSSGRGQREIDLNLHIGSRLPAYCTSMGKAMLAFLPDEERDAAIGVVEFSRLGPNTRMNRQIADRGSRARPRDGHRRQRRGARVRPALDRGAGARRLRRRGGRDQPRRPPDDGLARRPDRPSRPGAPALCRRDLRTTRLPEPALVETPAGAGSGDPTPAAVEPR